jgi:tripartite ATP-independent transporter DctP family solute receptor
VGQRFRTERRCTEYSVADKEEYGMKKELLLAMAFAAVLPSAQIFAQRAKIIKISSGVGERHPTYLACKDFERIVELKLPGKYDVQVFADAQFGDDGRATAAVRQGTLESTVSSVSSLAGFASGFLVFDLPFIIPDEAAADAVCDGVIGRELADSLESKGLKLLAYYDGGFLQLTNSAREVKSPSDLKGLKIRTMRNPIRQDFFKALGAKTAPTPFSEVFTALQQRFFDGQESPISTIYLSRFHEVQKFLSLSGHVYSPQTLLINKKLFDSFSSADQKVIMDAAQESAKFQRAANRNMTADHAAELRKMGMTLTELSRDQLKAFQDACTSVYAVWVPKVGEALVEAVRQTAAGSETIKGR